MFSGLDGMGSMFERRMDRRSALRMLAGAGAVALGGGLAVASGLTPAAADYTGFFLTTARVNLRTGPSTRRRVIMVVPKGAGVISTDISKNGFWKVSYQGTVGWISADYLQETNGGSSDGSPFTGFAVTTSRVNFRWSPSTSGDIYKVLDAGTRVEVGDTWQDGFRQAGYANISGWIYGDYLAAADAPEGYLTVTDRLNLRTSPSTSAAVLLVMPAGAAVASDGKVENGFRHVNYHDTWGWAYDAYLSS